MSSRDYTVTCLSEAIAPITHMAGTAGNESLVAREPVVTPMGVRHVPYLSGNAIRHRCVREPGFRWLVDEYGLAGELTLPQLNFLFHGGNLSQGGGREDTARIVAFQRIFPLGRLLGGALPDQILAGSLHAWRGTLVCAENQTAIEGIAPGLSPARYRPAETFVSGYQYTRGDSAKSCVDLMAEAMDASVDSNLMIFAGQAVMRGAAFVHGFSLPHVSERELGALLWSLSIWQASGGTVGGQASRGHGRLRTSILASDFDVRAAMSAYLDHARAMRAEAVNWLRDVFGALSRPRERKPEPAATGAAPQKGARKAKGAARGRAATG